MQVLTLLSFQQQKKKLFNYKKKQGKTHTGDRACLFINFVKRIKLIQTLNSHKSNNGRKTFLESIKYLKFNKTQMEKTNKMKNKRQKKTSD